MVWLPEVVSVTIEPSASQRASVTVCAERSRPGQIGLVVEIAAAEQDVLAVSRHADRRLDAVVAVVGRLARVGDLAAVA